MPGVNLKSLGRHRAFQLFWKYMSRFVENKRQFNRLGRRRKAKYPTFCWKNGAPSQFNATDVGDFVGQICIDVLNKDVYICDFLTSPASHNWKKISD